MKPSALIKEICVYYRVLEACVVALSYLLFLLRTRVKQKSRDATQCDRIFLKMHQMHVECHCMPLCWCAELCRTCLVLGHAASQRSSRPGRVHSGADRTHPTPHTTQHRSEHVSIGLRSDPTSVRVCHKRARLTRASVCMAGSAQFPVASSLSTPDPHFPSLSPLCS
jgi:hypothetical protein